MGSSTVITRRAKSSTYCVACPLQGRAYIVGCFWRAGARATTRPLPPRARRRDAARGDAAGGRGARDSLPSAPAAAAGTAASFSQVRTPHGRPDARRARSGSASAARRVSAAGAEASRPDCAAKRRAERLAPFSQRGTARPRGAEVPGSRRRLRILRPRPLRRGDRSSKAAPILTEGPVHLGVARCARGPAAGPSPVDRGEAGDDPRNDPAPRAPPLLPPTRRRRRRRRPHRSACPHAPRTSSPAPAPSPRNPARRGGAAIGRAPPGRCASSSCSHLTSCFCFCVVG